MSSSSDGTRLASLDVEVEGSVGLDGGSGSPEDWFDFVTLPPLEFKLPALAVLPPATSKRNVY